MHILEKQDRRTGGRNVRIRFGFVAMALALSNASPSQTMTATYFQKIRDKEAALRRITRIASSNLQNTLRILRYAHASGIRVYRFSSKLIPLFGHEFTRHWDFLRYLQKDFEAIGRFVSDKDIRVSFHPEHYTILNSPRKDVVNKSIDDLERHVQMLEAMGLDERAKLILHVGGGYQDKGKSLERFKQNWSQVPARVKKRLVLENDDTTFTASETLGLCQTLGIPMSLDIHHHRCHHEEGVELQELVQPVFQTWDQTGLVPKVHISSPADDVHMRRHADFIRPGDLIPFLRIARRIVSDLVVMVEAKRKDEALLRLVQELDQHPGFRRTDDGTVICER